MKNFPMIEKTSVRTVVKSIAVSASLLLASCQTSGSDGVLSGLLPGQDKAQNTAQDQQVASNQQTPGSNPNDGTRLINTQNSLTSYCPAVRLRQGTESYRIYKGKDRENPNDLRYQVAINKVARECNYVGQNLEIKVGARGWVITGPAGGPGSLRVPIRVAVQQGDCSRHFKLHQYETSVAQGETRAEFQFVDDTIVIPAPSTKNVRIYLGFDETPDAKASTQNCTG